MTIQVPDSPLDTFLKALETTASSLEVSPALIASGVRAVAEIFSLATEPLSYAGVLSPIFAGHDIYHSVRLAGIVRDLLQSSPPTLDSPLREMRTLVLLYASLPLHDIGMSLLGRENQSLPMNEIWETRSVRARHDKRSLEFIEEKLLGTAHELPHWTAFWEGQPDTPRPVRKFTSLLLARICESHGDPEDRWMQFTSLDTYSSGNKIFQLSKCWATEAWKGMRESALAAASVLSFSDLCDIGPARFPIPDEAELLKKLLPVRPEMQRTAFLHWLGHRVSQVRFEGQEALIRIAGHSSDMLRVRIPQYYGPCADLHQWGNKPSLLAALKSHARIGIQRVVFDDAPHDEEAWAEVERRLSEAFQGCWPFHALNLRLGSRTEAHALDALIAAPLWWLSAAKEPQDFATLDEVFPLNFILKLRNKGLLLEDCLALPLPTKSVALIAPSDQEEAQPSFVWRLGDSFIGSIRVARELMRERLDLLSVRLAIKGSNVHRDLRDGNLEKYGGTIFIVPILSGSSTAITEYASLSRRFDEENHRDIVVLFFVGDFGTAEIFEREGLECIRYVSGSKTLLRDYVQVEGIEEMTEQPWGRESSVTASAWSIYLRHDGGRNLFNSVVSLLGDGVGQVEALGLLILLTTYELLNVSGEGVELDLLASVYASLAQDLKARIALPTSEITLKTASDAKLLVQDGSTARVDAGFSVGLSLIKAAETSRFSFFVQYGVFRHLRALGLPTNYLSPLFGDVFVFELDAETEKFIFDDSMDSLLQVRLGLGLAERVSANPDCLARHAIRIFSAISRHSKFLRLEYRDFVAFQISYRLGRSLWHLEDCHESFDLAMGLESAIVNLGLLEAIASERENLAPDEIAGNPSEERILQGLVDFFLSMSGVEGGISSTMMAYDIVWHYGRGERLLPAVSALLQFGRQLGWDSIASYFHDEDAALKAPDEAILFQWSQMRDLFVRVLRDTPAPLRRERVSSVVEERQESIRGSYDQE